MASRDFLIDTQVFIWWMEKNKRLHENLFKLLDDPQNKILLSVASIWEIIIKKSKNRLKTPKNIEAGVKKSGFIVLDIELNHVLGVEDLDFYHKDPFDRILISQAKAENLTLVTSDEKIWKYDIPLIRA